MGAVQGEMQTGGAKLPKAQVFFPGEIDVREGSAAKGRALPAAGRIVQGMVHQQAMALIFMVSGKDHGAHLAVGVAAYLAVSGGINV